MITKKSILGISIGTILSLSLVATGFSQVFADEELEFSNLHFKTAPCRVAMPLMTPVVEAQLGIQVKPDGTLNGADCSVKAWFDEDAQALKYKIKVVGIEVEDTDGNPLNDIGKMHFHRANFFMGGNPDDPMGPIHILNIFKLPRMDDDHLSINAKAGLFNGLWDETDTFDDPPNDSTFDITEEATQEILCKGEAFLMIHGVLPDGSLPGFIKASIQPTPSGQNFCDDLLG